MGLNEPMHCYRQGECWLESGFVEKDTKSLVDNTTESMQVCLCSKEGQCIFGCDCQTVQQL